MTAQPDRKPDHSGFTLIAVAILGAAALWCYWPTLGKLVTRWGDDPQYSHGYLVPVFALYLLWQRRERLRFQKLTANALGLGLIAMAAALRLAGTRYHFEYFDQISLLPCCAGLMMLAGSWPAIAWAWPAVAFLAFMVPLPHSVSMAMSAPMQAFATTVSTFALQVLGKPAIAEGNVILLNDIELGIVEACSGLRMLVTFFALSTAVALLIRKPLWEKWFLAFSAIPIALATNVLRITVTGICFDAFGSQIGDYIHEYAGYAMPFVGFALLGIEWWMLGMLLIDRPERSPLPGPVSPVPMDANPLALYRSAQTPRREKPAVAAAPEPEAEPVAP
jgi:exosortase